MFTLTDCLKLSQTIPGWRSGTDAEELARASFALVGDPVIVEIGAFLGRSTVLLAGPRCLRGSGKVYCVDPFDCSGDPFSVPHYEEILASIGGGPLETHFIENIRRGQLSDWVEIRRGHAKEVAENWEKPIDLLLLDGDQSPSGARLAYESWVPFLKNGGLIALGNSKVGDYAEGHDGNRRLAVEEIIPPAYDDIRQLVRMTFARRTGN